MEVEFLGVPGKSNNNKIYGGRVFEIPVGDVVVVVVRRNGSGIFGGDK